MVGRCFCSQIFQTLWQVYFSLEKVRGEVDRYMGLCQIYGFCVPFVRHPFWQSVAGGQGIFIFFKNFKFNVSLWNNVFGLKLFNFFLCKSKMSIVLQKLNIFVAGYWHHSHNLESWISIRMKSGLLILIKYSNKSVRSNHQTTSRVIYVVVWRM